MDELYNFELPEDLIAQSPANPRDHAKLLIYTRKTGVIVDDYFYNLANYLPSNTTLVANNTKVDHCRYLFDGGKTEIFVIDAVNDRTVKALVRPGRKFKVGKTLELAEGLNANILDVDENGVRTIQFNKPRSCDDLIVASHVPLPPYIQQNDLLAEEYQTIYAKLPGSLAAPTAGLHFTPELKDGISEKFQWQEITLSVGLGTFAPLKEENFVTNKLDSESYHISESVWQNIANAKHVTAVGTTTLRTIESVAISGKLKGDTEIFITPGYNFVRVDSLITNFHLPKTSLLLLVEAFLGSRKDIEKIYTHAISERYRFYSFGDGMLIL